MFCQDSTATTFVVNVSYSTSLLPINGFEDNRRHDYSQSDLWTSRCVSILSWTVLKGVLVSLSLHKRNYCCNNWRQLRRYRERMRLYRTFHNHPRSIHRTLCHDHRRRVSLPFQALSKAPINMLPAVSKPSTANSWEPPKPSAPPQHPAPNCSNPATRSLL